jgi:hypothetical protein
MRWERRICAELATALLLTAAGACGDDGGVPLGDADADLDREALAATAAVPEAAVPADLRFDEATAPADARLRLRRFVERFQLALHRLDRAAHVTGNAEAQALIDRAKIEYRSAIHAFIDHEPALGIEHLREAARLLLEARSLLLEGGRPEARG